MDVVTAQHRMKAGDPGPRLEPCSRCSQSHLTRVSELDCKITDMLHDLSDMYQNGQWTFTEYQADRQYAIARFISYYLPEFPNMHWCKTCAELRFEPGCNVCNPPEWRDAP